ncbi:glycosyltransferase family 4 protein [Candidatus Gottesmanbacteria bacterium]|nr:glycosyltransferase family 4 protein [Candidatus Gottesmanbacteria bacterium]
MAMRIGIDARLINETGVGRYMRNLVVQLGRIDGKNFYIVFLNGEAFDTFEVPNSRWQKRLADVAWHSVAEQFIMPWLFIKEHLDLVHIPYFNVPIFYPGKFIVTIHDLTILHFDTGKATTLPLPFYKLRRLGYYLVLAVGLRRAQKIIAVSQTTKQEIIDHFGINEKKIVITHEGIDTLATSDKRQAISQYFLYVGNAYPHKNLETLLKAIAKLKSKLVLVGKDDYFYQRLPRQDNVTFFGEANDGQLRSLYKNAIALVFPSLMEGFGLPGLEAMAVGTPVVCSDIPVFREVYGEAALYFDALDINDLVKKLSEITTNDSLRKNLVGKGLVKVKSYSWTKLAEQTLAAYNSV